MNRYKIISISIILIMQTALAGVFPVDPQNGVEADPAVADGYKFAVGILNSEFGPCKVFSVQMVENEDAVAMFDKLSNDTSMVSDIRTGVTYAGPITAGAANPLDNEYVVYQYFYLWDQKVLVRCALGDIPPPPTGGV